MEKPQSRLCRPGLGTLFLVIDLSLPAGPAAADEPRPPVPPSPAPCPGPRFLLGPVLADEPEAPRLAAAQAEPDDRSLPINLATALRPPRMAPVRPSEPCPVHR
jgi:hypothetical protein